MKVTENEALLSFHAINYAGAPERLIAEVMLNINPPLYSSITFLPWCSCSAQQKETKRKCRGRPAELIHSRLWPVVWTEGIKNVPSIFPHCCHFPSFFFLHTRALNSKLLYTTKSKVKQKQNEAQSMFARYVNQYLMFYLALKVAHTMFHVDCRCITPSRQRHRRLSKVSRYFNF